MASMTTNTIRNGSKNKHFDHLDHVRREVRDKLIYQNRCLRPI